MAKAANEVLAGKYKGCSVNLLTGGGAYISVNPLPVNIDKSTVSAYEVVTEDKVKSGSSVLIRGAIGSSLLGPVGLLAGGLSARNKSIITIVILWKDNSQSLIEIDDQLYKAFLMGMF